MNPLQPETPEAFRLARYRVALIQGDRNATIWALWTQEHSLASIGQTFGMSRERARQIAAKAAALLHRWKAPTDFHADMPERLCELCLAGEIMTRDDLLRVVMREKPPRHWLFEDCLAAQVHLGLVPSEGRVAEALRRVGAVAAGLAEELAVLSKAQVAGADAARRLLDALTARDEAPLVAIPTEQRSPAP